MKTRNVKVAIFYIGETARSMGERYNEHMSNYRGMKGSSPFHQHCMEQHDGKHTSFREDILGIYRKDPTKRQISESENIFIKDPQLNRKDEWAMTGLLRQTKSRLDSLGSFHV